MNNNKVLFTTKYGSHLYGTNTPTSDEDYKHVVLPNLDDLLLGHRVQNEVHKTNNKSHTRNTAEDVDNETIPLQVFARDFLGGQTYALELVYAVDYTHAGQTIFDTTFWNFCHELRDGFLTSNMTALIGYAVNQASLYSLKGERLNALRSVKKVFDALLQKYDGAERVDVHQEQVEELLLPLTKEFPKYVQLTEYATDSKGQVMKPCLRLLESTLPYSNSFMTTLRSVNAKLDKYGSRADSASIDNVDWKATMHAIRVVEEGIMLLSERKLVFPFEKNRVEWLLSVKRGELPYEEVINELNSKLDCLKTLELVSTLPKKSPELEVKLNEWLLWWLKHYYNLKGGGGWV